MELPVPFFSLTTCVVFLFCFPSYFSLDCCFFPSFEVVFENCKCRSWCRPDDFVSSYTKSGTVLMYLGQSDSNLL